MSQIPKLTLNIFCKNYCNKFPYKTMNTVPQRPWFAAHNKIFGTVVKSKEILLGNLMRTYTTADSSIVIVSLQSTPERIFWIFSFSFRFVISFFKLSNNRPLLFSFFCIVTKRVCLIELLDVVRDSLAKNGSLHLKNELPIGILLFE